jgi:hypothetical protein
MSKTQQWIHSVVAGTMLIEEHDALVRRYRRSLCAGHFTLMPKFSLGKRQHIRSLRGFTLHSKINARATPVFVH